MKRALLSLLCGLPALAGAPSLVTELKGATSDGRYLVWSGGDGYDDPSGSKSVVQDLITGAQVIYLDNEEPDPDAPKVPGTKELEAWLKKHPVKPLSKSRQSPDKKSTCEVVPSAGGDGAWVKGTWESSGGGDWELQVVRAGQRFTVGRATPSAAIEVWWTANGKHTLWVARHSGKAMRDTGYDELIVGTDGSPGVSLVADKAKLDGATKVVEALTKGGFSVLQVGPAKQAREKSVVFAAKGKEAEAQKLASLVPGGAEVKPLDWKTPFELVVALGNQVP